MNHIPCMYDTRAAVLAIDSFENNIPRGRLHLAPDGEMIPFYGTLPLLREVEKAMDAKDLPRAFGSIRSFHPSPIVADSAHDTAPRAGDTATFLIRILFRQNASWQGSVVWVEGHQEQSFRSALELLLLLEGALSESSNIPA